MLGYAEVQSASFVIDKHSIVNTSYSDTFHKTQNNGALVQHPHLNLFGTS